VAGADEAGRGRVNVVDSDLSTPVSEGDRQRQPDMTTPADDHHIALERVTALKRHRYLICIVVYVRVPSGLTRRPAAGPVISAQVGNCRVMSAGRRATRRWPGGTCFRSPCGDDAYGIKTGILLNANHNRPSPRMR